MKKLLSLCLVMSCAGVSPAWSQPTVTAQLTASRQLERLSEDYWDTQLSLDPIEATFVRYPKYNDRLPDISAYGRAQAHAQNARLLAALEGIDRGVLGEDGKITYDVMKLELERSLDGEKFKFWEYNVDHIDGYQSYFPTVIGENQPMTDDDDAQALIMRMESYPAFFATQEANLREGVKDGRVAARVAVERLISQLDDILKQKPEETAFADAGRRLPHDVQALYLPDILKAVDTHVKPALAGYERFLKEEYLAAARTDKIGLDGLADGKAAYLYEIRFHTTLDKTPEELHKTGLDELAQIHAEMSKIAKHRHFKGDLNAFVDSIQKDPANFFTTRDEIVADAKQRIARAQAAVPKFFDMTPKTPLEVKPFEDFKEKNAPAAEYYEPSDDLTRPGVYYINTYEPQTRARFGMTSLAAHEGIPGHHFQIALAMEKRDLPAFRRHADFNAFIEGWALYCERLADEMGLYQDDLSKIGMLSDQALRAARLVVDTGIHSMGWSRQQAIDFMKANIVDSDDDIANEVDRYIIWPGQALSYKVGQREIMDLRKQSQKDLGKRFDIRRFHEDVLKNGAIPLSVLRDVVLERSAAAKAEDANWKPHALGDALEAQPGQPIGQAPVK